MTYRPGRISFLAIFSFIMMGNCISANAQFAYDTVFVRDYSKRILWSYFQEYRTLSLQITPSESLDPNGTETLLLNSSTDLYSGFLIQYNGISIYLAGSLPQTQENREEFGPQESRIWRLNAVYKGFAFSLNQIWYSGFYDLNYEEHEFASQEDANHYERYTNMVSNWWTADLKFYPSYRKFAQGIPYSFHLSQAKHKYSTGFRIGYERLRTHNGATPFFSPSLVEQNPMYGVDYFFYSGINLAVGPSFYLAWPKGWFIYGDLWAGIGGGFHHLSGKTFEEDAFRLNLAIPESRIAIGFQNRKWLASIYYSFQYESFNNEAFRLSTTFHNFGLIFGIRSNSPARWTF